MNPCLCAGAHIEREYFWGFDRCRDGDHHVGQRSRERWAES